jgi:Carboxypeptidase regulatory-like domain
LLKTALFLLMLMGPTWLGAETISGTIKDPSGAVIAGARIEISGAELTQSVVLSSDGEGKFTSPNLQPGTYSVRVTQDGFEPRVEIVNLRGAVQLQLTLGIAKQQVSVSVPGKSLAFANSDPLYRQLREIGLGQTFRVHNFTLIWDAATFQFQARIHHVLAPGKRGCDRGDLYWGWAL